MASSSNCWPSCGLNRACSPPWPPRGAGVRVAIISNSWGADPYNPYEDWELARLADVVLISHELGMRKPDPRIYRLAAERLARAPVACVLVDDIASNLPAARELGMRTIHHVDVETTISALEGCSHSLCEAGGPIPSQARRPGGGCGAGGGRRRTRSGACYVSSSSGKARWRRGGTRKFCRLVVVRNRSRPLSTSSTANWSAALSRWGRWC